MFICYLWSELNLNFNKLKNHFCEGKLIQSRSLTFWKVRLNSRYILSSTYIQKFVWDILVFKCRSNWKLIISISGSVEFLFNIIATCCNISEISIWTNGFEMNEAMSCIFQKPINFEIIFRLHEILRVFKYWLHKTEKRPDVQCDPNQIRDRIIQ